MQLRTTAITAALGRLRATAASSSSTSSSSFSEKHRHRTMHLLALVPATLSLVAFILSLLALTAGRSPSYLPSLYVLRVNTTQIATSVDLATLFEQVGITNTTSTGIPTLDSAISTLSAESLGDLLNTAAHELGLHDFYTAHATTWCEGALTTSGERVTGCTSPAMPFAFDPVTIIEGELLHNITLKDMGFATNDVEKVVNALETAYRSMSICYLLGVITAALCIVGGVWAVWQPARGLAAGNAVAAGLTVLCLGAASAVATIIGTRVRDVVNEKAKVINVKASNSTGFLALSWISVAAAIVVFVWWNRVCCCGRRGRSVDKEAGMEKWGARGEMAQRARDRRETEDFVGTKPVVAGHAYDGEGLLRADPRIEETEYRGPYGATPYVSEEPGPYVARRMSEQTSYGQQAPYGQQGPYGQQQMDGPYGDRQVDGPYDSHPTSPLRPDRYTSAAAAAVPPQSSYAPSSPTLTESTLHHSGVAPSSYASPPHSPHDAFPPAPAPYSQPMYSSPTHSPTRGYASPTRGYGSPTRAPTEPYITRTLAANPTRGEGDWVSPYGFSRG